MADPRFDPVARLARRAAGGDFALIASEADGVLALDTGTGAADGGLADDWQRWAGRPGPEVDAGVVVIPLHPRGGGPVGVVVAGCPPTLGSQALAAVLEEVGDLGRWAEALLRGSAEHTQALHARDSDLAARAALEALPEAVLVIGLAAGGARVERANQAAAALLGAAAATIAGTDPDRWLEPPVGGRLEELRTGERDAWSGGRSAGGRPTRVRVRPIDPVPGQVPACTRAVLVISEVQDTAPAQATLDALPVAVLAVDAAGRVAHATAAAGRLCGLPSAVLAGRDAAELLWPPGTDAAATPLALTLADTRTRREPYARLRRADGSPLVAAVSVAAWRDGDRVLGAVVVIDDTPARESSRVAEEFASVAAAVLPLAALDPVRCARLAELGGSVVELGWLAAGLSGQRRAVPVAELLEGVAEDLLAGAPNDSAARVEVLAAPVQAWADPPALRRALRLVVEHALRMSEPGATVTLDARREPGRVLISVVERGPAVPTARLARLFDALEPLDVAGARLAGSGPAVLADPIDDLALAVAQRTIEALGGTLAAAGTPGIGVAYTVSLPLRRDPGPGLGDPAGPDGEQRRG